MEEPPGEGPGHGGERRGGEVPVVALGLAGQGAVQGVVEVVAPLGGEPLPAGLAGRGGARVVEVGLGDQEQRAVGRHRQPVDLGGEFLQEVHRPVVGQGVHGVQSQAVDPVVAQPAERAADQIGAHLVGAGRVQVDRRAPRGVVPVGEVGAEGGEVVAGRAEVVVHHVENHAQALAVGGVDEALEALGAAVGLVHGPQRHTVVPPAVLAGERADGHQLDEVDAQLDQVVQPFGGRLEGAGGREGADVQLVQHRSGQRAAAPAGVRPVERGMVDGAAGSVRAVRLPGRARVRHRTPAVQDERVVPGGRLALPPPGADGVPGQRVVRAVDRHLDPFGGVRGPDLVPHFVPLPARSLMTCPSRRGAS